LSFGGLKKSKTMKKIILSIIISMPAYVLAQEVNATLLVGTDVTSESFQYGPGVGIKGSVLLLKHIYAGVGIFKHVGETRKVGYGSVSQLGVPGGGQTYKNNPTLLTFDAGYQFNIPITKSFKAYIRPMASAGYMMIKSKSSGVYGESTINVNDFAPGVGIAVGVLLTDKLSVGIEQSNYFLHGGKFHFGDEPGYIPHGYSQSIHYSAVFATVSYKLID
jgi:hypothetical protein